MRRFLPPFVLLLATIAAAGCKEDGTITVHRLSFNGVSAVDPARLKAVLATKTSSILWWGKKRYFDRGRLDADVKRIEAFYADRGYPDARVGGVDVTPNASGDAVDVVVTIVEGEPVRVASIDFVGFDVIPEEHLASMKRRVSLKVGEPRDRQLVLQAHDLAINELRDHGYPYAKVATREDDGSTGRTAAISFVAEPGIIAHFGPVELSGNRSVGNEIIRRELAYAPGDLYRRSLVQDTERRLYRMELFQFVNVQPLNTERQGEEVPTRVTVVETKHQRVNFGVGYGTEEKARADAEYHHLNFFGGARAAGAHVRLSSLDRGARVDFNQPYVFAPHLSLRLEGQRWYTYTPAYRSVVSGGKATLTHRGDANVSWAVSLTSEHNSSAISADVLTDLSLRNSLIALGLDPTTGEQNGTLNALGFDIQASTTGNALSASRGYSVAFHSEEAGRIVRGSFAYDAVAVDARHYLPAARGDRFVVATRLQLGTIRAAGDDEANVPFAKKYFLGGATSVRGWERYEISPLGGAGLPIGGDSTFAVSAELRAALRGKFGAVLFLDAGNVWEKAWTVRLGDLRYAIGPGLRYETLVGPVRFDVGYQLNPIPGLLVSGEPQKRRWRLHVSIGQAF